MRLCITLSQFLSRISFLLSCESDLKNPAAGSGYTLIGLFIFYDAMIHLLKCICMVCCAPPPHNREWHRIQSTGLTNTFRCLCVPMEHPAINVVVETGDLVLRNSEMQTVVSPITGARINRFLHVAASPANRVMQKKMQR